MVKNTYKEIQKAKRENEKWIVGVIKKDGKWYPNEHGVGTVPLYNALRRLEEKKVVRYSRKAYGYVLRNRRVK